MIRITLLLIAGLLLFGCQSNPKVTNAKEKYTTIEGETMGTYYRVTFDRTDTLKPVMDSLLEAINQSVSTYISDSEISLFNQSASGITLGQGYFRDNFEIAGFFYRLTEGYYDPTVMPLVNYWGFGYRGEKDADPLDSSKVNALKAFVGMDKLIVENQLDSLRINKLHPQTELDFSSVAKGYAVDVLADYLEYKGVKNYLVDIGGEMRLEGKNARGKAWTIGINTPVEGSLINEAMQYIEVTGKGLATSGNYRNFYEKDGQKISHTINPKTGYPERSTLLSATVLTDNCALADAWATSCMVLGLERSKTLLANHPHVQACLIYNNEGNLAVEYINDFDTYIIEK